MQITIARNLHGPEFGVGLTNSRVLLRESRFRDHWKTANGFRLHIMDVVLFIELWRPTFVGKPKRLVHRLYRRRSAR